VEAIKVELMEVIETVLEDLEFIYQVFLHFMYVSIRIF